MGWGIDFKSDIFLSKQDYGGNIYQVKDKIEELEDEIKDITSKLKMYAASNLKEVVSKEWEDDKISYISKEINELLEWRDNNIVQRYELTLYLEYLEDVGKK